MRKIIFIIFILVLYSSLTYSQTNSALTIKEIRQYLKEVVTYNKSNDVDNSTMYISTDDNGTRWLYIEQVNDYEGYKSDIGYAGLHMSKALFDIFYFRINYDLEKSISKKEFTEILLTKNIKGVIYKTKKYEFQFDWNEIIKKDKTD